MQVVGHHQEIHRRVQLLLGGGHQLIEGVEGLLGDAHAGVQLLKGQRLFQLGIHALRTAVAVGDGIAENVPRRVQQHIVHAPGVNADGHGRFAQLFAFGHALQDVLIQPIQPPAQVAVPLGHAVIEAVDLLQHQLSVFKVSQNMTSARGTHVNGQYVLHHASFLLFSAQGVFINTIIAKIAGKK